MESLNALLQGMGLMHLGTGQAIMLLVSLLLLWLAIAKKFEPLLLLPIGFGGLLFQHPGSGYGADRAGKPAGSSRRRAAGGDCREAQLHAGRARHQGSISAGAAVGAGPDGKSAVDMGYTPGVLALFYKVAIGSGVAPLVIFMGVGAMTDFGPLLANPRTLLLGAAAQFGIFATVLGALTLNYFGLISFTLPQAAAIGIIGGADGPTAIYLSGKLAPELLGAIAVAAYSYMALVPLIQPPIMRALTSEKERKIRMVQLRTVSKREKILFPVVLLLLVALLLPDAAPLLGMFCFGNLMRESGVVERLSDTVQNGLINIVTIFLGLSVGAKLVADKFLQPQTLGILLLGVIAFGIGTAAGVLMAKLLNLCSKNKINPLIGSAGVSAVPMAARVSNKVGLESDAQNFLLMHAMGPNVAGVIGSAIAAGVMLKYVLAM
ncbi:oxaloacetate decarboxylase subunit beta [Salmonella enterica subsp. enterica]|nr:oxaloacetate decarboxylase subunit beta [Salmonella enterica subsp. enterica]